MIVLYYMDDNISIGRANNIVDNILFIMYMDSNRFLEYNTAILEKWAQIYERPPMEVKLWQ